MAALPQSRSEGMLSTTGDASQFKSTSGLSHEGRITKRNGLSLEEVNCFRRHPLPSPSCGEKVAPYWQHIGNSRLKYIERGIHTLPNNKGAFYNRAEFKNPLLSTEEELHSRASATKYTAFDCKSTQGSGGWRRGAYAKAGCKSQHPPNPLDAEEEQLGRMVRLLFPSSHQQIARVGSSLRRSTPASRESSAAFDTGDGISSRPPPLTSVPTPAGAADMAKLMGLDSMTSSPTGAPGRIVPVQWDIKSPVGGLEPDKLRNALKLIKRETDMSWDPSASSLSANASRLVQGVTKDFQRDFAGTFSFHEGASSGKPVYKAMKQASTAVHYLVQAMGEDSQPLDMSLGRPQQISGSPVARPHGAVKDDDKCDHNTFSLREFRRRILLRFSSVLEAFHSVDLDANRKLTLKEWRAVLSSQGLASTSEARVLFELMDADKDGQLTLAEFHVGMESIAPVKDLESMRKRLLCLGCSSMMQALAVMAGSSEDITMRPLSFSEFASALNRVWIVEPAEHWAIFEAVRSDPNTRHSEATVSLAELACALESVSPCLILEELRDRLLKRWKTILASWEALCSGAKHGDSAAKRIGPEEFQHLATSQLGLTNSEAAKVFTLIDIDCSGTISRGEFLGAMNLSSPSLIIEDLRRKVRQRYLSIDLAFRSAFEHLEGEELNNDMQLSLEEFADILEPLEISRADTRFLFNTMAGDSRLKLTLFEFFKGVRLVAPSCILEGIRLQLIQSYGGIAEAFGQVSVADRRAPLDRKCFVILLQQLQVDCEQADLAFDFLDVRNTGIVTINEIAAALLNIVTGSWNKAAPSDREIRAEREVKNMFAPNHRAVNELKRRVKLGLREATTDHMPRIHRRPVEEEKKASEIALPHAVRLPKVQELSRSHSEPGQGDQRMMIRTASSEGGRPSVNTKSTFHRWEKRLRQLPPEKGITSKTVDSLRGYFKSAHSTLKDQAPLLHQSYSRSDLHRTTQNLRKAACGRPRPAVVPGEKDSEELHG